MSTPHPQDLLELYLQGELSDEECARVEAWLQEDPAHERQLEAAARAVQRLDRALGRPADTEAWVERTLAESRRREVAAPGPGPAAATKVPAPGSAPGSAPRLLRGGLLGLTAVAAALVLLVLRPWSDEGAGGPETGAALVGWAVTPSTGARWEVLGSKRLRLERGELAITSDAPSPSPLSIDTPHGSLRASGTRFVVGSHPAVPKGSVMISLTRIVVLAGVVGLHNTHGSVQASAGEWILAEDDRAPVKFAAEAQSSMGLDLYRALAGGEGNLCLSPMSIAQAFAMLAEGADGPVLEALATLLHLPPEAAGSAGEGARFTASLIRLRSGLLELNRHLTEQDLLRFDIANALWVDQSLPLAPAFREALAGEWAAAIRPADFRGHSEDERARINAWVEEITQGHIEDLLAPGSLNPRTRVVLANALYFQAAWQHRFPLRERTLDFRRPDGSTVSVPSMFQDTYESEIRDGQLYTTPLSFPYAALDASGQRLDAFAPVPADGVQILSYPYKGGRLSMDFLLPGSVEGLAALESALDEDWLDQRLAMLTEQELTITLPKFELAAKVDLGALLRRMGLGALFAPGGLQGMVEPSAQEALAEELEVADAVHQTWLKVDEVGTEAAAATAVTLRAGSVVESFVADRPFVYLIRDRETGAILFVGRVVDPSQN